MPERADKQSVTFAGERVADRCDCACAASYGSREHRVCVGHVQSDGAGATIRRNHKTNLRHRIDDADQRIAEAEHAHPYRASLRLGRENYRFEYVCVEVMRPAGVVDRQPRRDCVKMRIVHAVERNRADAMRIVESRQAGARGILLPWNDAGIELRRLEPAVDLAAFVERHWVLRWKLGERTHTQRIIGFPCVDLVFEPDGPRTTVLARDFSGTGRVFATKLRPGAWKAFSSKPVAMLVNRSFAFADAFGIEPQLNDDDTECQRVVEEVLRMCEPHRDPRADLAARIVDHILEDQSIMRADQVAEVFDIRERALQRLFARYVGLGVKMVIRLARLQLAAEHLRRVPATAALALDLGYCDQSHFDHDFRQFIGMRPGRYARGQ